NTAAVFAAIAAALVIALFAAFWGTNNVDLLPKAAESGETPQANAESTSVMTLDDGSRVEKRAGSEVGVEHVSDGLRINLKTGSIIVNAAKQVQGRRLYVQTRDVTVSVVGTVFLVKADEKGSQVAVIEGAVHVQQGSLDQKLQ